MTAWPGTTSRATQVTLIDADPDDARMSCRVPVSRVRPRSVSQFSRLAAVTEWRSTIPNRLVGMLVWQGSWVLVLPEHHLHPLWIQRRSMAQTGPPCRRHRERTGGVGKTWLALRWAHEHAQAFPDGQLYLNLRGFDPSGTVLDPADAAPGLLAAFGIAAEQIPAGLDAQLGLYRSVLSGKQVLMVLDNARDVEQVRPLLPGSAGCLVLVTSRNRLAGLVATHGARPLSLDLLTAGEARDLLAGRLGADRTAAEPDAVAEIIARCARLPLALAIAAARGAIHPEFPLSALADELRDAAGGLDAFAAGDAATDVHSVFSWSYRALSSDAARLFRLFGLHCGPDITLPAAASLAGQPQRHVRELLAELTRAQASARARIEVEPTCRPVTPPRPRLPSTSRSALWAACAMVLPAEPTSAYGVV